MRPARAALGMLALVTPTACNEPEFENLSICFPVATGRILVEVSAPCASDHRDAELSCEVEVDGNDVYVTAHGHDGRDPDDSCAPPLEAMCLSEPLPDGEYAVHFDDETYDVGVPNTDDSSCMEEI